MNRIKTMGASVGQIWRRFNTQRCQGRGPHHSSPVRVSHTRSNITPKMRRTMLSQVASPLSREELGHFQDIFKAGRFISADGATDYLESSQRSTPVARSPRTTASPHQIRSPPGHSMREAAMRPGGS